MHDSELESRAEKDRDNRTDGLLCLFGKHAEGKIAKVEDGFKQQNSTSIVYQFHINSR